MVLFTKNYYDINISENIDNTCQYSENVFYFYQSWLTAIGKFWDGDSKSKLILL